MRCLGLGVNLTCSLALTACSHFAPQPAPLSMLAVSVAELKLHLRDDSYRSFAHVLPDGSNVFEVTRWKLERLQRQRPSDPAHWQRDDIVLEFARARTLERLHEYREAAAAYWRVAGTDSPLAAEAAQAAAVMERFAAQARPLAGEEPALAEIDARIEGWRALSEAQQQETYASLALEEAESWEVLRVERIAREQGSAAALEACQQLLRRHRPSKLYPRHLLRFGDLHADAARQEVLRARTARAPLRETEYDRHLEAALSAYELASEARSTLLRREAQSRIQSLLAYHDGVRSHVY